MWIPRNNPRKLFMINKAFKSDSLASFRGDNSKPPPLTTTTTKQTIRLPIYPQGLSLKSGMQVWAIMQICLPNKDARSKMYPHGQWPVVRAYCSIQQARAREQIRAYCSIQQARAREQNTYYEHYQIEALKEHAPLSINPQSSASHDGDVHL